MSNSQESTQTLSSSLDRVLSMCHEVAGNLKYYKPQMGVSGASTNATEGAAQRQYSLNTPAFQTQNKR